MSLTQELAFESRFDNLLVIIVVSDALCMVLPEAGVTHLEELKHDALGDRVVESLDLFLVGRLRGLMVVLVKESFVPILLLLHVVILVRLVIHAVQFDVVLLGRLPRRLTPVNQGTCCRVGIARSLVHSWGRVGAALMMTVVVVLLVRGSLALLVPILLITGIVLPVVLASVILAGLVTVRRLALVRDGRV